MQLQMCAVRRSGKRRCSGAERASAVGAAASVHAARRQRRLCQQCDVQSGASLKRQLRGKNAKRKKSVPIASRDGFFFILFLSAVLSSRIAAQTLTQRCLLIIAYCSLRLIDRADLHPSVSDALRLRFWLDLLCSTALICPPSRDESTPLRSGLRSQRESAAHIAQCDSTSRSIQRATAIRWQQWQSSRRRLRQRSLEWQWRWLSALCAATVSQLPRKATGSRATIVRQQQQHSWTDEALTRSSGVGCSRGCGTRARCRGGIQSSRGSAAE